MHFQRQKDSDVPASISDVPVDDDDDDAAAADDDDHDDDDDPDDDGDADDANEDVDDVPDNDDVDMDDVDSWDKIVACLHADHDESEEDPILGPRKRPREEDDSPHLSSKLPRPQDSGGSLQSLQKSQAPPAESLSMCVSPPEVPT